MEKWKPELSSVNCVVLIPVSRLTGSTRPTPVVLKLFCETCSLVTILAGVGDAILTIKTPRFSNQPTRLLSRDCFMTSTGRYHKSKNLQDFGCISEFLFCHRKIITMIIPLIKSYLRLFLIISGPKISLTGSRCSGRFTSEECCHLVDVIFQRLV